MKAQRHILNHFLTAFLFAGLLACLLGGPSQAQDETPDGTPDETQAAGVVDDLFVQLALPEQPEWERIERSIWKEWSKSGSASMDLLLERGRDAMQKGDLNTAIAHLSALIDHAPEFAEGWNARATAFFQAQLFSLSIFDIQQTLALNPRHFGALQGLGQILEQLDDEEGALAAYQAAYSLHPHRPGLKDAIDRLDAKLAGTKL